MPDAFQITVDATKFKRALSNAPKLFSAGLDRAVKLMGIQFTSRFSRARLRGGGGLNKRTGNLAAKMFNVVAPIENGRALAVGFGGVPYANIHEFGGTITAKRSKYLTIPVGPALTASGVTRGPARSFPGLVFRPTKNPLVALLVKGEKFTGARDTKTGRYTKGIRTPKAKAGDVFFVLRKSVYIQPRLRFHESFRLYMGEDGIGRRFLNDQIGAIVAKINAGGAQS